MSGIDLSGLSVMIAMPHRDLQDINVSTTSSLVGTVQALEAHGVPYAVHHQIGGCDLCATRSFIVRRFLESDKTRLFWIDSDIVWEPNDFMKLLALSTRYEVIGACYRSKKEKPFYLVSVPTLDVTVDELGCMPVDGLGLGFTCMQRQILERLSDKAPIVKYMPWPEPVPAIFRWDVVAGAGRGEDMAFFSDIRDLGIGIHMDPSITLGHIGIKDYSGRFADVLQRS